MQKRLLKDVDDWHEWLQSMYERVDYIGPKSPPSFPCVVVWWVSGRSLSGHNYTFVERLDFGSPT